MTTRALVFRVVFLVYVIALAVYAIVRHGLDGLGALSVGFGIAFVFGEILDELDRRIRATKNRVEGGRVFRMVGGPLDGSSHVPPIAFFVNGRPMPLDRVTVAEHEEGFYEADPEDPSRLVWREEIDDPKDPSR